AHPAGLDPECNRALAGHPAAAGRAHRQMVAGCADSGAGAGSRQHAHPTDSRRPDAACDRAYARHLPARPEGALVLDGRIHPERVPGRQLLVGVRRRAALQLVLVGVLFAAQSTMSARTFSFEFFPPKTPEGAEKLRNVRTQLATLNPHFFSVTFGAGG